MKVESFKKIKVKFMDFEYGFDYENNIFLRLLRERYQVEISDDPDYIFYGPYSVDNLKYMDKIRIFFTAENVCPDFNLCDYGMGFEHLTLGDRYLHLPLFYTYSEEMLDKCVHKHEWAPQQAARNKFCSMVVSDSFSKPRINMFYLLSKYKQVDSGGRYLNNIGEPDGVKDKFAFDCEHKFSLCFENTTHPGYTTEKLPQAFAAGCIPIYWGDPHVGEVFNEKAFINANNYPSLEAVVERVKEIDNDDNLYRQMLAEPVFLHEEDYPEAVKDQLRQFLFAIFDQPLEQAQRKTLVYVRGIYHYIPFLIKIKSSRFLSGCLKMRKRLKLLFKRRH